jgi:hypothetical protein
MKFKPSFFLALLCLAITIPAQASMHPNAVVDGWIHFMWHAQMTVQAAQTGNWSMFWQLFTEQSVCTSGTDFTFVFTPAFFMLASALLMAAAAVILIFRKMRKVQTPWWNQFRRYSR